MCLSVGEHIADVDHGGVGERPFFNAVVEALFDGCHVFIGDVVSDDY